MNASIPAAALESERRAINARVAAGTHPQRHLADLIRLAGISRELADINEAQRSAITC